eukprot:SAG11_NODE_6215_length_1362_cov_2.118765_1_plen_162_part_00
MSDRRSQLIRQAGGALFDVCISLRKGQRNAFRDGDVRHLQSHALRGAHRDCIPVPLFIQFQRGIATAEIGIDVVAAVPGTELEGLVREWDGLIADVHWHRFGRCVVSLLSREASRTASGSREKDRCRCGGSVTVPACSQCAVLWPVHARLPDFTIDLCMVF